MFRFSLKVYIILVTLIVIIGLVVATYFLKFNQPMNWGVTFSWPYTQFELGLDPQEVYLAILDDLKVDHIRLSAYWNEIEIQKGQYDFSDLDFLMKEAKDRNVKVILAVGRRLPRWPECHDPLWLSTTNAIEAEDDQLKFVEKVVTRYKDFDNILYWQVENEPYLSTFGICPPLQTDLFKSEIKLVKKLSAKPVLVTDSGELSTWWPISQSGGDILGTTLYRVVYNPTIGYFRWFTPPFFYWIRVEAIKKFTSIKRVIVAELQVESWHKASKNLAQMTLAEHNESMSLNQFKANIDFTRRAGFDEAYLWGVEWWYFMKTQQNYPSYWEEAKKLWANNK